MAETHQPNGFAFCSTPTCLPHLPLSLTKDCRLQLSPCERPATTLCGLLDRGLASDRNGHVKAVFQRSTGVQTSPEKGLDKRPMTRVMEAERSRLWLEELKQDVKHKRQYFSANLEVASQQHEQYARKRMQAEDIIAERLKRELTQMTLQDTSREEEEEEVCNCGYE